MTDVYRSGHWTRRRVLGGVAAGTTGILAGCTVVGTGDLVVIDSGVEMSEESAFAWANIENTEYPDKVTAVVYFYFLNDAGTIIGPERTTRPGIDERVTRTTLEWFPLSPSQLDDVAGVDVEIADTFGRFMGSNPHATVDERDGYRSDGIEDDD